MNRLSCGILAAVQLAGTWLAVAQAGTDLGAARQPRVILANKSQSTVPLNDGTSAAITLSGRNLDFGGVPVGSINELSFTIQNVGAKVLTLTADVSPPFSILGGSPVVLKPAQTQVITVRYAPGSIGVYMTVVHLTGADGVRVTVMGSAAPRAPAAPARRPRAPTQPEGQRLLAGH